MPRYNIKKITCIFSFFLGTSLMAQTFKLDVQFEIPFGEIQEGWYRPVFNDLILNQNDKKHYEEYLLSKIKDTNDYLPSLNFKEEYYIQNSDLLLLFDNFYYYQNKKDHRYPLNISNDTITRYDELLVYDEDLRDVSVDENGDPIYKTVLIKEPILNSIRGVHSKEQWIISKKEFSKYPKATLTILMGKDDYGYNSSKHLSFTQLNSKKPKWKKKYLFRENLNYNYLFYPSVFKLQSSSLSTTNNIKNSDSQNSYIDQYESENAIKFIINELFKQGFKVKDLKGNFISFNKELIEKTQIIDLETGDIIKDTSEFKMFYENHIRYSPKDFAGIHFTEDWYFDPLKVGIFKKVKEIQLLVYEYDENHMLVGYKALPFSIVFE